MVEDLEVEVEVGSQRCNSASRVMSHRRIMRRRKITLLEGLEMYCWSFLGELSMKEGLCLPGRRGLS